MMNHMTYNLSGVWDFTFLCHGEPDMIDVSQACFSDLMAVPAAFLTLCAADAIFRPGKRR